MESPNSSTSKTLLLGLILATGAVLSCGTDGGTGPDRLTIADFAGLAYHHARAVIDKKSFANAGARVDVYSRGAVGVFGDDAHRELIILVCSPITILDKKVSALKETL